MNFPPFGTSEDPALQASTSTHAVQFDAGDTATGLGGEQISKRTLQNRKAQREFRARRQAYLRDLEDKVRRYESGQADTNTLLQRQVAQLQAENDQLRLQLAEMSRSHHAGQPAPPPPQQHQAYRAPMPQSHTQPPPQPQRGLDQQPLYFPESELRNLPTSPTFEPPQTSYSPVSQESLSALGSPPHALQHPGAGRFPGQHTIERDPQRISTDDSSARLSSFDLRTGRTPYSRPGQPPSSSNRLPYMDATDTNRSTIPQTQSQPPMTWSQLPNTWYSQSSDAPQSSQSQPFVASEYDRFRR